jgi:3-(3-hydroxy-phenyl)propionate hydroxylase
MDPRGGIAPRPMLGDGTRLDDNVGYALAVLARDGLRHELSGQLLARLLDESGIVVVQELPPSLDVWLRDLGAEADLVRPDRYIFGAARNAEEMQLLIEAIRLRDGDKRLREPFAKRGA